MNTGVSVIIVNYNTKELTLQCVESLKTHTKDVSYEIILVDNASTDGTTAYLDNRKWNPKIKVEIIHSAQNVGGSGGFSDSTLAGSDNYNFTHFLTHPPLRLHHPLPSPGPYPPF